MGNPLCEASVYCEVQVSASKLAFLGFSPASQPDEAAASFIHKLDIAGPIGLGSRFNLPVLSF